MPHSEKVEAVLLRNYFDRLADMIPQLPYEGMAEMGSLLARSLELGQTIFVFGNGGSAATASHFMCDLNKGITESDAQSRFRVMALTDNVPLITAWANDVHYDQVFAEQLSSFVKPGDLVLAISASGNSSNILAALQKARECGATTLGIAGYGGGDMINLCDLCVVVPSDNMQMIEDMQHAIVHALFTAIRQTISERRYKVHAATA